MSSVTISSWAAVATAGALIVWFSYKKVNKNRIRRIVQCQCGSVKIQIDAASPTHLTCYCDDCQNYERYCRSLGGCRHISDRYGGIRIFQVYKTDVVVLAGRNRLQCTALDPKKLTDPNQPFQMFRFHADCCKSPMISAYWRDLPVMGVLVANLVVENDSITKGTNATIRNGAQEMCVSDYISDDAEDFDWNKEQLSGLPQVQYRVHTKFARSKTPLEGALGFPNRFVLGFLWRNFFLGIRKNKTSPMPLPDLGQEVYRDM
jgi:hypothetical protein